MIFTPLFVWTLCVLCTWQLTTPFSSEVFAASMVSLVTYTDAVSSKVLSTRKLPPLVIGLLFSSQLTVPGAPSKMHTSSRDVWFDVKRVCCSKWWRRLVFPTEQYKLHNSYYAMQQLLWTWYMYAYICILLKCEVTTVLFFTAILQLTAAFVGINPDGNALILTIFIW